MIYIPGNQKDLPPYDLLRLMYSCKNFVISNSTFIWRAAHLSDAKNKIVVAPHIWRNRYPELYKDIYEDYWILFDGKTGERYGENKDINYCSGI